MKQQLVSLWRERLSPTQKRLVVVGSVCTLLFTSLYLAVREPSPESVTRDVGLPTATTPLQILATNRLDDFTIASLSNSVNELNNSITQLQQQNANLQAELQALKGAGATPTLAPVEYFPEFNTPEHLAYLSAIMRGLPRIEQLEVYDAFLAQYPERRNQAIEELLGYRQYLYELGIDETTYLRAIGKGVYPDGTPVGATRTSYPTSAPSANYGMQGYSSNYPSITGYTGFDRLADFTVSNPSDPYGESHGAYNSYLSGGVGSRTYQHTNITLPTRKDVNPYGGISSRGYFASLYAPNSQGGNATTVQAQRGMRGVAQQEISQTHSLGSDNRANPNLPLTQVNGLASTSVQGNNTTGLPAQGSTGLFASLGIDPLTYQRTVQVTEQGWVLITSLGRIDLRLAPAASADWQNTILYAQGNVPVTSYQGGNNPANYDNSYTDPYGTVYNSAGQVQSHANTGDPWNDGYANNPSGAGNYNNGAGDNLSSYLDSSANPYGNNAQSGYGNSASTGNGNSSWNQQLEALNRGTSSSSGAATAAEPAPAQPLQIKSSASPKIPAVGINLPAGAVFTGNLVTGVDAATHEGAKQDPYPVLVKLANLDFLPNNFKSNLESCFLLLSSYGDLSSSRALMRTQSLSCINQAGYIIEGEIKGYAVGADGKLGLRGRLVSKQGSLIAKSLSAGLLQGLAEVLAKPNIYIGSRVSTGTAGDVGDLLTQAGLSGVGKAVDRVANFYLTLANKMFPLVEVGAGVNVDVVLTAPVQLSISERRVNAAPLQVTGNAVGANLRSAIAQRASAASAQGLAMSQSTNSNNSVANSASTSSTAQVQIRNYSTAGAIQPNVNGSQHANGFAGWTSGLPSQRQQLIDQFWQGVQEQRGATAPPTQDSLSEMYRGLEGVDSDATTILEFPAE